MAQIVKLKRTSVSGKTPTTSNLALGELAMNTYDGRIFFEKSSSEESIQEILTTNSHPFAITGSLYLNGAVTASFFKGDGSQLTNLPTDISIAEATTVTASYDSVDDITVTHNFNSYNVLVSVYDNNRNLLIPATTSLPTVNTARVTLSNTQSGFVVVAKGGHLISGSQIADNANKLNSQAGSYYLNWTNFNNIPAGIVSQSAQLTSDFDTRYLNTDADSIVSSSTQIITLVGVDEDDMSSNSATKFPSQQSVKAYVDAQVDTKDALSELSGDTDDVSEGSSNLYYTDARVKLKLDADTVISGSAQILNLVSVDEDNFTSNSATKVPTQQSVKAYVDSKAQSQDNTDELTEGSTNLFYTDARVKLKLNADTIVSGSTQITDLTTHKETVSGASSYAVDHNLSEQYPIVQAWNTATSQQEVPVSITTNSTSRVTVVFSTTFAGIIIVKK
jgi:hypothetical protein